MADRNQSYDALFLRAKDSPAGDRIVSVLTADAGIFDAFVFGGARSSLRSSASPFVHARIFVYEDPVRHYRKLSDLSIIESFSGLRGSYATLWSASLIAELILKTSGCGGEYGEVMDLSLQALRLLDSEPEEKADMILLAYLWKILAVMGLQPDLDRCASCGKKLVLNDGEAWPRTGMRYSTTQDGFVCEVCGEEALPSIAEGVLGCMRSFSGSSLADCAALDTDDASLSSLKGVIYYLSQKAAEGSLLSLSSE